MYICSAAWCVNCLFELVVLIVNSVGHRCSSHSLLLVVCGVVVWVVFELCFYRFTWCLLISFACNWVVAGVRRSWCLVWVGASCWLWV